MTIKFKLSTFFILVFFIFVSAVAVFFFPEIKGKWTDASKTASLVQEANVEEIYPLFLCPCCGEILDPKNICCGMAREMIDFINNQSKAGVPQNEIILSFVKKYGLNVFADKEKQKEFKEELVKAAPADRPVISLSTELYDWGDVSQRKGEVSAFFDVKNEGKSDLIINQLDSSCGCTSASVVFQNKEGPRFAMAGHGIENPTGWQIAIPAGQTAQLKVYYDPNVHQDLRGPVTRTISIFSNDPIDFEKKLTIEINQID